MAEQAQSFPGAFCEPCNKWRKPDALMPDGSCPRCRTELDPLAAAGPSDADGEAASPEAQSIKIPWHFWLMVAATLIYLGWRVIQGIMTLL